MSAVGVITFFAFLTIIQGICDKSLFVIKSLINRCLFKYRKMTDRRMKNDCLKDDCLKDDRQKDDRQKNDRQKYDKKAG